MPNNDDFVIVCEQLARHAGAILLDYMGKIHVNTKSCPSDLVTEADGASQTFVAEAILRTFPKHTILGEENQPGTSATGGPGIYRWILDPLDGTTNYVHGFPNFCVSLALEYDGILQTAAIFNPIREECFTAQRGHGAFLNGKPIHTSKTTKTRESLVSVGFPPNVQHDSPDVRGFMNVLSSCHAIRRTGSTALNLAFVASGRLDATWNFHTNPWDIAAGVLLVQEAGGAVTGIRGEEFDVNAGHYFAAATEPLKVELLQKIHG